jgi:hypothetical protein
MNLEQLWQKHQPNTDGLPELHQLNDLKPVHELSVLKKLKKMLGINMGWALLIAAAYVIVLVCYPYWQIQALIGIALVFTLWGAWSAWQLYQKVEVNVQATSLLAELQRNSEALKAWMQIQTRVALFVYPFCIAGGFLLGGVIGSGKSIAALMQKPLIPWALIAAIILLTPLSYLAAKWMFRVSFGKLLKRLEENIQSLTAND